MSISVFDKTQRLEIGPNNHLLYKGNKAMGKTMSFKRPLNLKIGEKFRWKEGML